MWYYIKQDGLCVYASNQVKDVNDWLNKHQAYIKKIYTTNLQETIIEVR